MLPDNILNADFRSAAAHPRVIILSTEIHRAMPIPPGTQFLQQSANVKLYNDPARIDLLFENKDARYLSGGPCKSEHACNFLGCTLPKKRKTLTNRGKSALCSGMDPVSKVTR
jgi:hypothetical protein